MFIYEFYYFLHVFSGLLGVLLSREFLPICLDLSMKIVLEFVISGNDPFFLQDLCFAVSNCIAECENHLENLPRRAAIIRGDVKSFTEKCKFLHRPESAFI